MSKLRDYVNIIKTKVLTAEKLKKLCNNNGYIALLTGGKSFGYTTEILPKYLQQGEILAIPVGGAFNVKYHNDFYYNANNYILQTKENLYIKYLYYQFQNKETLIKEFYQGWGCKKLKIQSLLNLEINLPCISRQQEIVRILDKFTELTSELKTELTARKKQYEYYRGKLLTFKSDEVEWKKLGEVCEVLTTGNLNANAMEDDGIYPFFTCNETPYKINTYAFDLEALLISGNGSQVGHLNYYQGKFNAYQRTYVVGGFKNDISIIYIFHYLKYTLRDYIAKHSRKGSVPYITMPMLNNFSIPIPPIEVQQEIVRILDKFDSLTNSISEGLPREIELRQKQYEYYRNELLNFEL